MFVRSGGSLGRRAWRGAGAAALALGAAACSGPFPQTTFRPVTRYGALENSLFGASVTTAGLLPGRDFADALRGRDDLDLVLLPGESVNDDGLFIDSMRLEALQDEVPAEIRLSKDFADVLGQPVAA